jgi:hypothetical protein
VDDVAIQSFAMPIAPSVYPVWAIAICVPLLVLARIMVGWRWTATMVAGGYVAYRCLIWPLLTFTIFPPSVVPFWLLVVGVCVDAVFLVRANPYLRAVIGAVVVSVAGYGAMWLQTVVSSTPTDLADRTIGQLRQAFEAGHSLHMVPVAWTSIWVAGAVLLLTWAGVTLLAARTFGLSTPRPPVPTMGYGPEPSRDARGALDGWADSAADASTTSR